MKNLKIPIFLFLVTASMGSFAQEGLMLMPMEQDTVQIQLERQIEYRQLISGNSENNFLMEKMALPEFDYKAEFSKRYSINYDMLSFSSLPLTNFSLGIMSPFYQNGMVLSEAAYKIGDKFTFGGFSYGANSMLMPPPVPGINNFNRYGSTMFMQYKVGKNFKIETRVNVSQGGMYPGF